MSLATWASAYSQYGPNNTEEFDSGMESKKAWDYLMYLALYWKLENNNTNVPTLEP